MPRDYKPDPRGKRYMHYEKEEIDNALKDIKENGMSYRCAAKKYKINYSVLYRHGNRIIKQQGGQTALSADVEQHIIDNINTCAEWGYPLDELDLRMIVKMFLDKKGINCPKFKNNFPGRDFAISFLKRYKAKISERYAQNIKRARAEVNSTVINSYFENLKLSLKDIPAKNIINYDETNLSDDPGKKKIIAKRGTKYPERVMNSSKTSTSVMMAGTANGLLLPPYVIYKALHLYDSWTNGGPKGTRYNRSMSGWIDLITFEDWVNSIVISYRKQCEGKMILIGDNLTSHLSLDVIKKCKELDIDFVFLPANSTHLTQPLDVAFFAPLKKAWREILTDWKKNEGRRENSIPKSIFPLLLNKLYKKIEENAEQNLKSGFKKTGIYPLNPEEVLNRIPKDDDHDNNDKEIVNDSVISLLRSYRYPDVPNVPKKKKKLDVEPGKSVGDLKELVTTKETSKVKSTGKSKQKIVGRTRKNTSKTTDSKAVTTGPSKPEEPSPSMSQEPDPSMSQEPDPSMPEEPGPSMPEKPGPSMPEEPGPNKLERPGPSKPKEPGPSKLEQSGPSFSSMLRDRGVTMRCNECSRVRNPYETWLLCIACKKRVCPECTDEDVLAFEFICKKCFYPDESDDSIKDKNYIPSSEGD